VIPNGAAAADRKTFDFSNRGEQRMEQHLYGPVASRRLGRSLGVDIVKFKICSYDCVYCQLGKTDRKTIRRERFYPPAEILDQIRKVLKDQEPPDYVTFSGSGEPTLNADLGELIRGVKEMTDVRVAVITNSSLIWDRQVQEELLAADLVVPSLDAAGEEAFQRINRPHPDLDLQRIMSGLIDFRSRYSGQMRLEILLVEGINDAPDERERLRQMAKRIAPDGIDLNTVVRPPAEVSARPLSYEKLEAVRDLFGDRARIVFRAPLMRRQGSSLDLGQAILEMVGRRPCTLEELASALGRHRHEVSKYLGSLLLEGRVVEKRHGGGSFYALKGDGE
jgi:wyosine [tRNA(Phe)-imidazoG37] synthetase (radical SAM superfamily)